MLVIVFIADLQIVTASNYSAVANPRTLQFTTTRTTYFQLSPDNGFRVPLSYWPPAVSRLTHRLAATSHLNLLLFSLSSQDYHNRSYSSLYSFGTDRKESTSLRARLLRTLPSNGCCIAVYFAVVA
jgi:hypothetical protein